jgi:hypothetical protein
MDSKMNANVNGLDFNFPCHYQAIIGKHNFLEKSIHPYILYVVPQLERCSSKPKEFHGIAVKHFARYFEQNKRESSCRENFWQSKHQTTIALSTTEGELITLSEAPRFI